jgi:amino acid transporter
MKWLGVAKVIMIFAMIIMGFLSLIRVLKPDGDPLENFQNAFSPPKRACPNGQPLPLIDSSCTHIPRPDAHSVSWALMSIIFSFSGWNSINFVLGEVKDPNRSMKLAGFTSIALVTTIYMLANIAIFAVIPARDIGGSDLLISGDMFERATKSKGAAKAAGVFVALSNLGNVFSFSFALARIVHEYAKSGMFPFSGFFAKTTRKGSPAAGVSIHLVFCHSYHSY